MREAVRTRVMTEDTDVGGDNGLEREREREREWEEWNLQGGSSTIENGLERKKSEGSRRGDKNRLERERRG